MLRVERKSVGGVLTLFLEGEIDETADFVNLIGNPPMAFVINARGVDSINSSGIGVWLKFVERLANAGVRITYAECSPAFAGCLSFVVAPKYKGKVESVVAPFHCKKCKADFDVLIKTPDIFAIKPQLSGHACGRCKGPLTFDELVEEYFAFLA
jgi:anti-anti-sigma regulatory factor